MASRSSFEPHTGVDRSCPECNGLSYRVIRDGERAVAQLCSCVRPCPHCRATGFVAKGEGFRAPKVRCRCQVVTQRIRHFNEAMIPARHAGSTLMSFQKTGKAITKVFTGVYRYTKEFHPDELNRGMVLSGDVGRGKTHLMVAVLRDLAFQYGATVRFVEFSHLIADLKSSFDRGSGSSSLLDPLARVDVLAIDELGKGRNTEFEGTVLDELISRRYNAGATILATSNYWPGPSTGKAVGNLANPKAADRPRLVDRVGDRIYSRLEEMCDFIGVEGKDFRLRHRPWAS